MKPVSVRNAAIALAAGIGLMAPAIYADMHGKGMMGDQKGGMMQMSGMMGKGMMMDAEQQRRMNEMRRQMDAMGKKYGPWYAASRLPA